LKEHFKEESLVVPKLPLKETPLEITTHLHNKLEGIIKSSYVRIDDLKELKKDVISLKEQLERGQTHLEEKMKTIIENLKEDMKDHIEKHESKIENLTKNHGAMETSIGDLRKDQDNTKASIGDLMSQQESLKQRLENELEDIRMTLRQAKGRFNSTKKNTSHEEIHNSSESSLSVHGHQSTRDSMDSDYGSSTNSRETSGSEIQIKTVLEDDDNLICH
jgi:chromosome segregation ATPase